MLNNSQSVVQNYEVNQGSQSCSTMCGTPKLCITWSKNKCTTDNMESSPSPTTMGIILTYLVSLSKTVSTPLDNLLHGKSVMKSIDHTEKRSAGLSISYNKPAGAEVKSFCHWQTRHPRTNAETSHNKPGYQTQQSRENEVLWIPKYPPRAQCISYNKSQQSPPPGGMTRSSKEG